MSDQQEVQGVQEINVSQLQHQVGGQAMAPAQPQGKSSAESAGANDTEGGINMDSVKQIQKSIDYILGKAFNFMTLKAKDKQTNKTVSARLKRDLWQIVEQGSADRTKWTFNPQNRQITKNDQIGETEDLQDMGNFLANLFDLVSQKSKEVEMDFGR